MKIGIVAGETSGDLLGALLIKALKQDYPQLEFVGIAGPKMQSEGAVSWYSMEKLAVRGYVEVLKSYREILSIRNGLKDRFLKDRPALFIGIDAPDFNLGLERALKAAGIPAILKPRQSPPRRGNTRECRSGAVPSRRPERKMEV